MTAILPFKKTYERSRLYIFSGIIGNIVEHYDTALYGFLAPFIAPLFFPTFHPITQLILAYAILPLDILAKPLGSLLFGRIGDRFGRTRALSLSITCSALSTGLMGCLPIYSQIGILAPILLALTRFSLKFFSAGECVGAAIFILEHQPQKNQGFLGSLFSCSTVIGILLASALTNGFEIIGIIHTHWRFLFWIGTLTSLVGLYIRYNAEDGPEFQQSLVESQTLLNLIRNYWKQFLAIMVSAGFSYATYEVSFMFFNTYPTFISSVTNSQMLTVNTILLALDMVALPVFGLFADKISSVRQMQLTSIAALFLSIPLFALCKNGSLATIICIRTIWVLIGVAYCAPFHAWSQQLIPVRHRYTIISLSYTIGSQLIGAPFAALALWLYRQTELAFAPGIYLAGIALLAFIGIKKSTEASCKVQTIS